jgi:hypothetical protein
MAVPQKQQATPNGVVSSSMAFLVVLSASICWPAAEAVTPVARKLMCQWKLNVTPVARKLMP